MSESLSLSLCSHSSCCSVLPPRFLSCLPTYQITVLLLRSLSKMCTIYLFVYLSIFHLSTHCFLYSYSSFNIHFLSFLFIFFLLLFWSVDESMIFFHKHMPQVQILRESLGLLLFYSQSFPFRVRRRKGLSIRSVISKWNSNLQQYALRNFAFSLTVYPTNVSVFFDF